MPISPLPKLTAEHARLLESSNQPVPPWRKWGPYVSERSWGTVREDYSEDGRAWEYLPHDHAHSKAYRWGEDGIAAICDRYQLLVFSLALWNGHDPFLKERMFGLSGPEGSHGEDVKECYFYLDNTPTHSYMRFLYKYPQEAFPYQQLIDGNREHRGQASEYELLDTGIFARDRYFDVFVEFAKAASEDICVRVTAWNRASHPAILHLLPQLWFRNTWSWTDPPSPEPSISARHTAAGEMCLVADDSNAARLSNLQFDYVVGKMYLFSPAGGEHLFTDNETNAARLYGATDGARPYVKDAFHRYIAKGEQCLNPAQTGTKAGAHYRFELAPTEAVTLRLRLCSEFGPDGLRSVDEVVDLRQREADEFYAAIHPQGASPEERAIQRQALAGMLWNKQIYLFDVERWLEGDNPHCRPSPSRMLIRNCHWRHLNSMRVLTVPDKWEFPWFAAWDLAFQCVTLALVDPHFAKENLWVLLFEQFQHPNGQIPACEWDFSDLNPPLHAWACWRVFTVEREKWGRSDPAFLERCFHKLLINFAWWVNRVDRQGNNVFEGGFLGLDNISIIDRSDKLGEGAVLEQSDGTGWMAFFCLYMMRIAMELARSSPSYEALATKFFEHFVYIGAAMKKMGGRSYQLWDQEDGFFYDVLRSRNGEFRKFRLRSMVGLIPLFAVEVLLEEELRGLPELVGNMEWFIRNRPDLVGEACYRMHDGHPRYVLGLLDAAQFARVVQRLADPDEFLSPYGIRSLSKYHAAHPFRLGESAVCYEPGLSASRVKGGNSNWRGPVWFPTCYLLMEALLRFSRALPAGFKVAVAGQDDVTPQQLAAEIAERLIALFRRDASGRRPCFGNSAKQQTDPHWRDHLLFHEFYDAETGKGLGASHQTGWTGLIANLIDEWRQGNPELLSVLPAVTAGKHGALGVERG